MSLLRIGGWVSVSACMVLAMVVGIVMKNFESSPLLSEEVTDLTGKKCAELILADGQRIKLENNEIELQEGDGTLIVNDTNLQLVYLHDTTRSFADTAKLRYNILKIPSGADYLVKLSDGTRVHLNCETEFRYPVKFAAGERRVYLDGEAFFEVAHDAEHPFIVKANQINVEVLGTRFNVKAYEEDDWIEVSLSEGKVEVQSEDKKRRIFLSPGEQAYYDKHNHSLTTRTVDIAHYTSWRNGIYYFRALPLKEIVKQLERIFNVNICITSSNIEDIILTGDFLRGENLEQILRVITADKRLKYRIEEYMIYIDENKRARKRIY